MPGKTFNIGEYSKSGVISVEINGHQVIVILREWDFRKGSNRTSDQTQSKELDRIEVKAPAATAYRELYAFLTEDTSHYYAEQVINYIKKHTNLITAY